MNKIILRCIIRNGFRSRLNRMETQAANQSPLCKLDEGVRGGKHSKENKLRCVSAKRLRNRMGRPNNDRPKETRTRDIV